MNGDIDLFVQVIYVRITPTVDDAKGTPSNPSSLWATTPSCDDESYLDGANNFDSFFFPFTFHKIENQCFTVQEASIALANKEKNLDKLFVDLDLKWNLKCLQDFSS